jgi:hypothetical protein
MATTPRTTRTAISATAASVSHREKLTHAVITGEKREPAPGDIA